MTNARLGTRPARLVFFVFIREYVFIFFNVFCTRAREYIQSCKYVRLNIINSRGRFNQKANVLRTKRARSYEFRVFIRPSRLVVIRFSFQSRSTCIRSRVNKKLNNTLDCTSIYVKVDIGAHLGNARDETPTKYRASSVYVGNLVFFFLRIFDLVFVVNRSRRSYRLKYESVYAASSGKNDVFKRSVTRYTAPIQTVRYGLFC